MPQFVGIVYNIREYDLYLIDAAVVFEPTYVCKN